MENAVPTTQLFDLTPYAKNVVIDTMKLALLDYVEPDPSRLTAKQKKEKRKIETDLIVNALPFAAVAAVNLIQWLVTPPTPPPPPRHLKVVYYRQPTNFFPGQ
jgi:hypothetical protein